MVYMDGMAEESDEERYGPIKRVVIDFLEM